MKYVVVFRWQPYFLLRSPIGHIAPPPSIIEMSNVFLIVLVGGSRPNVSDGHFDTRYCDVHSRANGIKRERKTMNQMKRCAFINTFAGLWVQLNGPHSPHSCSTRLIRSITLSSALIDLFVIVQRARITLELLLFFSTLLRCARRLSSFCVHAVCHRENK